MKTLETNIIIDATAEKIWAILMDFEAYPNWNPFIKTMSGNTEVGNKMYVTIQLEGNKAMVFEPRVLTVKPNRAFRWLGHLWITGIFDGEHYFQLIPINEHQTKFIHGEHFRGLLSGLILGMIKENTLKGFQAINEALKWRAEHYAMNKLSVSSTNDSTH